MAKIKNQTITIQPKQTRIAYSEEEKTQIFEEGKIRSFQQLERNKKKYNRKNKWGKKYI